MKFSVIIFLVIFCIVLVCCISCFTKKTNQETTVEKFEEPVVKETIVEEAIFEKPVEFETQAVAFKAAPTLAVANFASKAMRVADSYDVGYVNFNTEEYSHIHDNGFSTVSANPFSTFAADVDTASYANLRRLILSGSSVPSGSVRIEEMINYFQYDYPEPQNGEPFSVTTEISPCPWNASSKLLRVGLQAKKIDKRELPQSNLVFLIDVSGSMYDQNKLPLVKRAFSVLLENLSENDTISIVTYASGDRVVLEGVKASEKAKILDAIQSLEAGGATHGSQGIQTAYKIARNNFIVGGNNRVILATDGDLNVGITNESDLVDLIEKQKKSGVYLSVLGFGYGNLKDNKMQALSNHGNGNYSYIDSIGEARKVLVEEIGGTLFAVAKDVKIQLEFNPANISAYRLIGYEDRLMNAEDFSNDKKDGGEIGAGHRVTALYEIIDADSDFNVPNVESRYIKADADMAKSDELLTVNIRYKEPDGDISKLLVYPVTKSSVSESMSDDMSFVAGVAQFGMILRNSEYKGTSSVSDVRERLKKIPNVTDDVYKEEFLYLMNRYGKN